MVAVLRRGEPGGRSRVVVQESGDKMCLMDECQGKGKWSSNNDDDDTGEGGGSLDRKHKKRLSITSTSSSMSMLPSGRDEHNLCANGDVNNNNNNNKGGHGVQESGRESFGSASSFTKDIMRMIGERSSNNDNAGVDDIVNEEDKERKDRRRRGDRRPSEVILRMNRRNSDMSEKAKFSHIICECPCHEEAFEGKKGRFRSSLASPNSVNIYSIEEPTSNEGGKGQLEKSRSDNDEDGDNEAEFERRRAVGEEYDNDELAYEDEVVDRRRRSVL